MAGLTAIQYTPDDVRVTDPCSISKIAFLQPGKPNTFLTPDMSRLNSHTCNYFGSKNIITCVGSSIEGLSSHLLKRLDAEQLEVHDAEKYFSKAEQTKLKKSQKRHQQLRLIAGAAAGVFFHIGVIDFVLKKCNTFSKTHFFFTLKLKY